jgi:uncharacterized protein (DUF2249 family)
VVAALPAGCEAPDAALEPILQALERMPADGVLEATCPFDPAPLAQPLAERGYRAAAAPRVRGRWTLVVQPAGAPEILDLRDLESPEPLERILEACAQLVAGGSLLARTPRVPRMLFPQLEKRSLEWEAHEEPDGSGLVWVHRPR